ncbi:MAG: OmpA family protein [Bacteroidales bacterium]|jgi:outer membrane protein OmpA-like peptidoglycan-associated protein|nr:OmpA family protein [Bacteroidales bacterium]
MYIGKKYLKFYCTLLLIFLCLISIKSLGQANENLIYNPSFEQKYACPQKIDPYGYMKEVVAWWQPTGGSSDYYHKCGSKQCSVPKNKLGNQMPHSGDAMVGIYVSKTDYREYIQTQLKSPLQKGEEYYLSFYVSLSEYSSGTIATIGGLFTDYRIEDKTRGMLTKKKEIKYSNGINQYITTQLEPQVVNPYKRVITDTKNWTKIEGRFIAQGGEEFLTIGNFFSAEQSNVTDLPYLTYLLTGAYFYIDDVDVHCLTCKNNKEDNDIVITKTKDTPQYEIGQVIVLENIFFAFDKSDILPQSFVELNNLIKILNDNPSMRIELSGHTDNKGSKQYNATLSHNRAKAVYNYLIEEGINKNRLTFTSFGAEKPIATNKTDEGRAKNRRVEFKILQL